MKDRSDRGAKQPDARAKLRESELRYRTLFDNATDAIFLLNGTTFIDCNRKALVVFGYSKEQIIGQTPCRLSPPWQSEGRGSKEQVMERKKAALRGTPQFFEWKHRRHDGTVFDAEVSLNKIESDRRSLLLQAIVRDISARKEVENNLRISEEKYRTIFENATEGIFQSTPGGRFITANPSFARMHGYRSPEELMTSVLDIGKDAWVNPPDRERYKDILEERGAVEAFETEIYRKDRSKAWFSLNVRVVWGPDGRTAHYEGTAVDITERKKAAEELKIKSLKLEEVNAALRALLNQREQDKTEMEDKILSNIRRLVLPYIEKLKERRLDDEQKTYLSILETNLDNIISPYLEKMVHICKQFTPSEILAANLFRDGKTVKEIARILGVSDNAINHHRQSIRDKLGLNRQKLNLKTYLMSLR